MNLFNSPLLSELSTLIGQCENSRNSFNLIVDHDGEVLIENNSKKVQNLLPRYKFYFPKLRGKSFLGMRAAYNVNYINQLYKNLLYCWEQNLSGAIDFNKISNIENINRFYEINNFSQPTEIADVVAFFLRKNLYRYHKAR
jgi:hypothetical protein